MHKTSFRPKKEVIPEVLQLVTFKVGAVILAIDIAHVQEINRNCDITDVPGAIETFHGVINLRGEVVTVLNPYEIFGIAKSDQKASRRNLILNIGDERIAVMVDRVLDILEVSPRDLVKRPSSISTVDRKFIDSVYLREDEIVVVVDATALEQELEVTVS